MYIEGILVFFSFLVIGVKLLRTKKIEGLFIMVATLFILKAMTFAGVNLFIFYNI